ncbi:MAG TPA: DUF2062 domain-containing protein [Saprospiraceae bacterium]|nr:DUF2062 domain-containing protein [Saprospiraceae bacterium]
MGLAIYTRQQFQLAKACVLIATYNNAGTILDIILRCRHYCLDIIVVNDGSTDDTIQALSAIKDITVLTLESNQGKGNALKIGMQSALERGFCFAITLDADDQHFPEDLPYFAPYLTILPEQIIIGSRNMNQAHIPGKSTFGNKFSNFWIRLFTGFELPDTQSGFRAYPLSILKKLRLHSWKYEFEVEILVKAAWKGYEIRPLPIRVYYPPTEVRVSHFRPFRDFTRISILNTLLFIRAFFYEIPKRWWLRLRKQSFKITLQNALNDPTISDYRKAAAIGFGVFMGIFPVWGYQLVIGWATCHLLRLNKILFTFAAHISIPPMIPILIYLSYWIGRFFVKKPMKIEFNSDFFTLEAIKLNLIQYLTGAVVFSVLMGAVAYILSLLIYRWVNRGRHQVQN